MKRKPQISRPETFNERA